MTERTREILGWYGGDNPGTLTSLARVLGAGALTGTGRLLILPVDQGFEHGPARSFGPNPPAYDPAYHFRLAVEAGCSALAAPLGFLERGAREFAGEIPLILKLNGRDTLGRETNDGPTQALYGSVEDALRLGCVGVGYTIYPGSKRAVEMCAGLRDVAHEAKARGLFVVVWSYPRGGGLAKEAELGAHIIKVKLPSSRLALAEARRVYEERQIATATPVERVRHVVQAAFAGYRLVIFSGGPAKARDQDVLDDVLAVRDGGGFGTIMGRNTFQRSEPDARKLLGAVAKVWQAWPPRGGLRQGKWTSPRRGAPSLFGLGRSPRPATVTMPRYMKKP
jgi:class I fructose-bisphosphate aldolase